MRPRNCVLALGLALVVAIAGCSSDDDPAKPGGSGAAPTGPPKAARGGIGATLTPVDGGPDYYGKFSPSLPTDPTFFPIAVWFESVKSAEDTTMDSEAGLNTYVVVTDDTDLKLIKDAGMYVMHDLVDKADSSTVGWTVSDEADMWGGPGNGTWTGSYSDDVCKPAGSSCGYSVQRKQLSLFPKDKRMRYSNYGKGVMFWETDAQAAKFINDFQDVVSVDTYWFTDLNICGASEGGGFFGGKQVPAALCHRAANYGMTMDRVRKLVKPAGSKPVWAFVEVGHPFTEQNWPSAKPAQVVAGVWSSIIHGARGIIYFNHSFAGPCETQHALREDCYKDVRTAVTGVNAEIKELAPVLNAPFATGVAEVSAGVDISAKWYDGHYYLIAGSTKTTAQTASFTMQCVGDATVTVLHENRTINAAQGAFTDEFADGNAVHVYRIDGGSSCGAY